MIELDLKHYIISFTGTLEFFTRKQAYAVVKSFGGQIRTSISKDTTHLVVGQYSKSLFDSSPLTNKEQLALESQQHNIPTKVINETEFLELIETIINNRKQSLQGNKLN